MSSIKSRLEHPYKATTAETVDLLTSTASSMCNADGPLAGWAAMAKVVAGGAQKHARGDWRERDAKYFLPKILRHLHQAYGNAAMVDALISTGLEELDTLCGGPEATQAPQELDEESGTPHLIRAAVNAIMAWEVGHNKVDAKPGMVYLAAPYSINPELSLSVCSAIVKQAVGLGEMVYSPVVYGVAADREASYDYWMAHCLAMLAKCDSLVIVKDNELGDWTYSKGVVAEALRARELGIPVSTYDTQSGELVSI